MASAPKKVSASHILIKHQGSRRKASWKDPQGTLISSTTRDAAVSQLSALRSDILSGVASFPDLASRYSDCSSAKRGGDLGIPLLYVFNPRLVLIHSFNTIIYYRLYRC